MKVIKIIMPDYLDDFGPQPQIIDRYRHRLMDFANYLREINKSLQSGGYGEIKFIFHSIDDQQTVSPNSVAQMLKEAEENGLTLDGMVFEDEQAYKMYINARKETLEEQRENLRAIGKAMKAGLLVSIHLDNTAFDTRPLIALDKAFGSAEALNQEIVSFAEQQGIHIDTSDDKNNMQYNYTKTTTPEGNIVSDTGIFIVLQSAGGAED